MKAQFLLPILFFAIQSVFAQFPRNRFTGTTPPTRINVTRNSNLQQLINNVGNAGAVFVFNETSRPYTFLDIKVNKSNIHFSIHKDAVFRPNITDGKNHNIFVIDSERPTPIENVKIYCHNCENNNGANPNENNTYKIDIAHLRGNNSSIRAFLFINVNNFHLSDFYVNDRNSKFSAVALIPRIFDNYRAERKAKFNASQRSSRVNNALTIQGAPKNGVIQNGLTKNSAYGFGLIQMQSGQQISFKNLHSIGGVTLRLESGGFSTYLGTGKDVSEGEITGIQASKIICRNGQACVTLNPHGRVHGSVEMRGLTSVGSAFAVKSEEGFIDREIGQSSGNEDPKKFKRGVFNGPIIFSGVKATFKSNRAQIKSKDWRFYPRNIAGGNYRTFKPSTEINVADETYKNKVESVAAFAYFSVGSENDISSVSNNPGNDVLRLVGSNNVGDGKFKVTFRNNVRAIGFQSCINGNNNEGIIYLNQARRIDCGSRKDLSEITEAETRLLINSTNNTVIVSNTEKETNIQINDLSGKTLHLPIQNSSNQHIINTSELNPGIYIVSIKSGTKNLVKKIIKN